MLCGGLRSTLYAIYVALGIATLSCFANAQTLGFKGCGDIEVTTVSHEDTVVLPLHIHAYTTCGSVANMQLYIDGAPAHGEPGQTLDYDWTSATSTSHRVVVQGVDSSSTVKIKSQALTVNVAAAPPGMTGIVNIWNPTGCPAANSCPYAENVPGTFYVDAKAYSNQSNIHNLEVWLDGVKKDENLLPTNNSTGTFHSTVALSAPAGNHRLVVQATDASSAVIAKTATYFNVTGSNVGTLTNQEGMSLNKWITCSASWDPCLSHYPPTTFTQGSRTGVQFNADGSWCCDQSNNPVLGENETAQRHYQWPSGSVTAPPTFNPNPSTAYSSPFKYVKYEFDVYVPSGALTPELLVNNLEWETQQRFPQTPNGTPSYVRNLAFEDNYDPSGTQEWRSYDFYVKQTNNTDNVTTRWQSMGVPYTYFAADTWYHVVLEAHLDESISGELLVRHDAIWAYPIGSSPVRQGTNYHNSHIVPSTTAGNETTNAVQLGNSSKSGNDTSGVPPWHIWMDNIQITYTW